MKKIIILITINIIAVSIIGILHYTNNKTIGFIIFNAIIETAAFWCGVFSNKSK
jgi:hypothetical protein